ncbi:MAG: hypothetical protein QUS12_11130, partial [Methanosarcina sp.]|nr:hypothetical protein [Methanosarcina sp.]
ESRASAFFESTNGIDFGYSPGSIGVVDNQYHCILPLPQNNSDYSVILRKSNKQNPGDPENGLYNRMVINGNYDLPPIFRTQRRV